MKKEHFTKTDLLNLPSCFLDAKGNFIFGGECEIGVHESLACEILDAEFGEDFTFENYDTIFEGRNYHYEYLEEVLGYFRYSHWVGEFGVFNGEKSKLSFAQKLAIKEFCKIQGATWEQVYS